jgi:cobyrinic acid a,c-diamide synthase
MSTPASLPKGLIIAAPRSGAGKTTFTLGLMRALTRRGVSVAPFKCGPDYIDPAFHSQAVGRPSFNIDSWAMRWPVANRLLLESSSGADIVIAEALMGLFDGVSTAGQWGTGASADLAAKTGWPVVLVLDVSGQSQTAAAVARGFQGFRDGVTIAGVVLNRVGSDRHTRLATEGLEQCGMTVLGALPRDNTIVLPERHLGLVQAEETSDLKERLDALADFVEKHVNIDSVLSAAKPWSAQTERHALAASITPPGQRIALARDAAFSFVYPHLIKAWRDAGADILPFSPLADEAPSNTADVAWLPGGYPELYAKQLAGNQNFKTGLRQFAETRAVHGECGGYMVLGAGLIDADGTRHQMCGLLGLETSFANRRMQLGYRKAVLRDHCILGRAGQVITGHEFHYATIVEQPDAALFDVTSATGEAIASTGSRRGLVSGSFFHMIDDLSAVTVTT